MLKKTLAKMVVTAAAAVMLRIVLTTKSSPKVDITG
jgi:hypothetical protein